MKAISQLALSQAPRCRRTFWGEVRRSDAFPAGHAQVADRCSPVRSLLTNAA